MKKIILFLIIAIVSIQWIGIAPHAFADCGSCGSKLRKFHNDATTKKKARKKWRDKKRKKFGEKKKSLIKQRKKKGLHKQRRIFGH